ncbi:HD-domain/PDEase-like protein [Blastocladiella britannica]|nr:HD-domain/PDEase-like protein [Blastocladiella britannica]
MATLKLYAPPADASLTTHLLAAAHFAAVKHRFQKRKDGGSTPYINHPLGVAALLANEAHVDKLPVLMAAILHDTVEDTDTSHDELVTHFGAEVARIVAEVTDDRRLASADRKRAQVEMAAKKSADAQLVKLADKCYNLRDLCRQVPVGWTVARVQQYFAWSKSITDQIKHVNPHLERLLDDLYTGGTFTLDGSTHKCLVVVSAVE